MRLTRTAVLKRLGIIPVITINVYFISVIAAGQTRNQPAVVLTAADMSFIVDGLQTPEARTKLMESIEERRAFAKDIRELLAVAEAAKAESYMNRPELSLQMELARSFVIAQAYFATRSKVAPPHEVVSQVEIDAFFSEPGTPKSFEAFLEDYQKNGPDKRAPITDDKRKDLRNHYGRVMVAKRKGIEAGLDRERKIQLTIMVQEARLLAGAYWSDQAMSNKPTEVEVDQYIVAHPELDSRTSKAKAEEISKRARMGEDFSSLARQFSDEESTKHNGGDLGWFGRGRMVEAFEDAAFALRPGEISGVIETPFGFHVIRLAERRTQLDPQGKPVEQVRVSHILILFKRELESEHGFRGPAWKAVENEKRSKWIDGIVRRGRVVVPEDFKITAAAGEP